MADLYASDGALMTALKKGDTTALATIIERWQGRLLHFIYRYIQNEAVARDLTEETFVRVYQARKRFDEGRNFSTWMFGIAANLCRNHYRWWSRRRESPLETTPELVELSTPADQAGNKERDAALAAAILNLPDDMRVSVLLYYYDDMDYRGIGAIVGCSVRGVESRLYRARKLLARALKCSVQASAFSNQPVSAVCAGHTGPTSGRPG